MTSYEQSIGAILAQVAAKRKIAQDWRVASENQRVQMESERVAYEAQRLSRSAEIDKAATAAVAAEAEFEEMTRAVAILREAAVESEVTDGQAIDEVERIARAA